MQEFVGILKQQLVYLQATLDEIKQQIATVGTQAERATSTVRTDLERQLQQRAVGLEKQIEKQGEDVDKLFSRANSLDKSVAWIYGGVGVCGALGISGLAALIRGLS